MITVPGDISRLLRLMAMCLCLLLPSLNLQADVQFEGEQTTPKAPATLKDYDYFEVGGDGTALLRFPDSAYLRCLANTKGQILPNGLILQYGTTRSYFKKRGTQFTIQTPTAIIGVRGTLFDLLVTEEKTRVSLLQGRLEVASKASPQDSKTMEAGQVCEISKATLDIRPATPADILDWYSQASLTVENTADAKFERVFLTGLVTVHQGQATMVANGQELPLHEGKKVPVGAVVRTGEGESLDLRLGCGSGIRLAPSSNLNIGEFGVELLEGAMLVRHTRQRFPLKIQGPGTILLNGDSVGEIRKTADSFQIRVQKGTAELPEAQATLNAGQLAQVKGSTMTQSGVVMPTGKWEATPSGTESAGGAGLAPATNDLFEDSPEPAASQTTNQPDTRPQTNTDLSDILKP